MAHRATVLLTAPARADANVHLPAACLVRENVITTLGTLPAGCEVVWYRYFRYNGARYNRGLVMEHMANRLTKFATPINDNKLLVVPMSSDLRVRVTRT